MDGMKNDLPTDPGAINVAGMEKHLQKVTASRLARQHLSRLAEHLLADEGTDGLDRLKALATSFVGNSSLRRNIALLIRDFCAEHMRPEIRRFAGLMEMKLLKHDPARGQNWKRRDPLELFEHINELMGELETAVNNNHRIGLKAADIANHVMMLADLAGELDDV